MVFKNVRNPQNVTFNVIYSLVETSLLLTTFPVLDSKKKLSIIEITLVVVKQPLGKNCLVSSTDITLSKERTQLQVKTA